MTGDSGRTELSTLREKYPREIEEFDREVKDYYDAHRLNDAGYQLRSKVRDFIFERVVSTIFKPDDVHTTSLHLVGSSANGCGLRNCDLDLCLMIAEKSGTYPARPSFVVGVLGKLKLALRSSRCSEVTFRDLQLLKAAKVPIVKLTASYHGQSLHVDVCVNQFNSIDNTRLLCHYAKLDERFPMLCVLVKLWARSSGLNDAWRKTFSSYALNLLVLHYLVSTSAPPVLPNLLHLYTEFFAPSTTIDRRLSTIDSSMTRADALPSPLTYDQKNMQSIGELMLGFFDHYSHFDFANCGISVKHGACVSRSELPPKDSKHPIVIVDPYQELNPARHITGKTFPLIVKALRSTLADLLSQATAPIVDSETDATDNMNDIAAADGDGYSTAESDEEALLERSKSSQKLPPGRVANGAADAQDATGGTP